MKDVIIGMAVYSLEHNNKDEYLEQTLDSLRETVDYNRHKIWLSVNAHTERTLEIIKDYTLLGVIHKVIFNGKNLGTAEAVNLVWKERKPGQHAIKMDDDVTTKYKGWVDEMIECFERDPRIGIIGLKRKDLIQSDTHESFDFRTKMKMLPHKPGERWYGVEVTRDVMGTCTMYNSLLLDKIGYLKQPSCYGYDDCLASIRARTAGFYNCFLNYIEINHIDPGGGLYQDWKSKEAGELQNKFIEEAHRIELGKQSFYYNPFE
jgi:GT2 family glycosyltransferase